MDLNDWRTRQWAYPFFGLPDNYKIRLYELLFDLCYYGKIGGFSEAYEMPVQSRTFYYRKLANVNEKDRQAYEKARGAQEAPSSKTIVRGPAISRLPS